MTSFLLAKEYLKKFYAKYEVYLKPLAKFLLALVALSMLNKATGYMARLDSFAIVLILALMCSFMPSGFIVICCGLVAVAHFYALSMEAALVGLFAFLILTLIFFRFSPKDAAVVVLLPVLFVLKIPYVVPICAGLLCGPVSAVTMVCGVAAYFIVHVISENAVALTAMEAESMSARFRLVIDGLVKNRTMIVFIAAFAVTLVVVYVIRRLSVDHSWKIAVGVGAVVQLVMLLIGALAVDAEVSVFGTVVGSVIAVVAGLITELLFFNVDYARTEHVQFEDDEYYYYVKAVPKVAVTAPEKTVKQINTQNKKKRNL